MRNIKILAISIFTTVALALSPKAILAQEVFTDTAPDFYYLEDAGDDTISVLACFHAPIKAKEQSTAAGLVVSGLDCKAVAQMTRQDFGDFFADLSEQTQSIPSLRLNPWTTFAPPIIIGGFFVGLWQFAGLIFAVSESRALFKEGKWFQFLKSKALYTNTPNWGRMVLVALAGSAVYTAGKKALTPPDEYELRRRELVKLQTFKEQVRTGMVWGEIPKQKFAELLGQYATRP